MTKYIDLIGRILISVMFLMSGINKIGSYSATQSFMESNGVPGMLLSFTILFEIGAPLAVIIGWQIRWVSLALAGFSVLTAILFHANFSDQMQMIMFMKNITITGGFLILAIHRAGEVSLDHKLEAS
jgi:putative oxidoreductase